MGLTFLFYVFMLPFEKTLVKPTVKTSLIISSLIFGHVESHGNTILIGNVAVIIEEACTPVVFWALLLGYISLDWKGKKSIITLLLGSILLFIINALRIPLIVLLVNQGFSFLDAHQISEYVLYLLAFLIIVGLNSKV
nr:archaeosortase/exosortase family protein [Thermococcus sp.]